MKDNENVELGILQKKILAFKPCYAKVKIPTVMHNLEHNLTIPMPLHISATYGDTIIPEGTRLMVTKIEGEYKIIGFYDAPKPINLIGYLSNLISGKEPTLPKDYGLFRYDEIKEGDVK